MVSHLAELRKKVGLLNQNGPTYTFLLEVFQIKFWKMARMKRYLTKLRTIIVENHPTDIPHCKWKV